MCLLFYYLIKMSTKFLSTVVLSALFLSSSFAFAQDAIYCADLNQPDFEHYDLFNQDIENKKVIMIGEMHYMAPNSIVQANLLIHVNKHFGIRHLLIEFGQAEAYLYNQYLQTGDEWYLQYTFHGASHFEEFYSSMKNLYEYNLSLDNDKKIMVHGLDYEREPGLSATIYKLLSSYTDPQIKNLRDSVYNRLDTIGIERDTQEYIRYLRKQISKLPLASGKNKRMIRNILDNKASSTDLPKRDQYMAEQFQALDTTNEAYLGQFGFAHTMLNSAKGLAVVLNNTERYRDSILVINMYYMNSKDNHPMRDISGCPVFLLQLDAFGNKFGSFGDRGQWALVLKDQHRYTQQE